MDKVYYLTDNLLVNDELEYNNNSRIIKINNKNWRHYLSEYGWEKLPIQWIKN